MILESYQKDWSVCDWPFGRLGLLKVATVSVDQEDVLRKQIERLDAQAADRRTGGDRFDVAHIYEKMQKLQGMLDTNVGEGTIYQRRVQINARMFNWNVGFSLPQNWL